MPSRTRSLAPGIRPLLGPVLVLAPILLLALAGCQPLASRDALRTSRAEHSAPEPAAQPGSAAKHAADDMAALAQSAWHPAARPLPADSPDGEYRWQHEGVKALAGRANVPKLKSALEADDPAVAANAAIALARMGESSAIDRLVDTICNPQLATAERSAAAETLGRFAEPAVVERLAQLVDRFAPSGEEAAGYATDLHAELLRALARHPRPSDAARFTQAIDAASPDLRLAALRGLATLGQPLPPAAIDLRTLADARVRIAALDAITATDTPEALDYLDRGLDDLDLEVRLAVVRNLGQLARPDAPGVAEARQRLARVMQMDSELLRAAAVTALAGAGDESAVLAAGSDKSWRVRLEAAKMLARFPSRRAAALASDLFKDQSPAVELAMVASLAAWPLEKAGPRLLEACDQLSYRTRKDAAGQLTRRWAKASPFSPDAPPERRAAMLVELRELWRREFGDVDRAALAAASTPAGLATRLAPERMAMLQQLLKQAAIEASPESREARDRLRAFGADLEDGLEVLALDQQVRLPEFVFREILPPESAVFAALDRLKSEEVAERRRAAARLAALAAKAPPRPLARLRLAEQGVAETDGVVWLSLWQTIGDDPTEPSVRLACAALSHPSPDVRRRACEYLARHGDPKHASLLIPTLGDTSAAVARAAAAALGRIGSQDATAALERMLVSSDMMLRFEAAASLARLGNQHGQQALERLSFEPDFQIRGQVATLMGELGDPVYLPTLIRLLDDRDSVRRAALDSLPRIAEQDVARRPGEPRGNFDEQRSRWKEWWRQQQTTSAVRNEAAARSGT